VTDTQDQTDCMKTDPGDTFKGAKPITVDNQQVVGIIAEYKSPNAVGGIARASWNLGWRLDVDEARYGRIDTLICRVDVGHYSSRGDRWYLCCVQDCFDPPLCLVQADSLEEALSIFETECEDWAKIPDEDVAEYHKELYTKHHPGATDVDQDTVQTWLNEVLQADTVEYNPPDTSVNDNGTIVTTETHAITCSHVHLIVACTPEN